jgi:hypothetical protein
MEEKIEKLIRIVKLLTKLFTELAILLSTIGFAKLVLKDLLK